MLFQIEERLQIMPCRTLAIGIAPPDVFKTIDRYFEAAFGSMPEMFQWVSWRGWRPITDDQRPSALLAVVCPDGALAPAAVRAQTRGSFMKIDISKPHG
jgi:hypothetical protein